MKNKKIQSLRQEESKSTINLLGNKVLMFIDRHAWVIFLLIMFLGLYLRFYRIEDTLNFGWDQARDAWTVRDILMGKFTLIGPRTGIGHFHIGAIYFYLLVPFYYLTNFDPMGANYLNILLNVSNFMLLFFVIKKIFNNYAALFAVFIYSTNSYLIGINQVPWNVTLMPGVAALIFYSILRIYKNEYKWFYALSTLSGLYFHLHFTAIFLPFIIFLSLVFLKHKIRAIKYLLLSLPLYLIWFVPNIIYELQNHYSNANLFQDFLKNYFLGFHFRFFIHRLPDAFVQFATIINFPKFLYIRFVIPLIFAILIIFNRKDKQDLLLGYLISLWFLISALGFTFYSGPISEYYFLYDVPLVLFIIVYLHAKLLKTKFSYVFFPFLIVFWVFYAINNTKDLWIKPGGKGLREQRYSTGQIIKKGKKIKYNEGDIRSYLYTIWKQDNRPKRL